MASFYFTLASLPSPESGAELPSPERFLETCDTEVDARQRVVLSRVLNGEPVEEPFVVRYRAFDRRLRWEVARWRAQALGWPVPEAAPEVDEFLAEAARQVVGQESPLVAEESLDRMRDRWLEQAAFQREYGWEHLLAYALRLTLWWKRKNRDLVRGRRNFEENYRKITQNRGV